MNMKIATSTVVFVALATGCGLLATHDEMRAYRAVRESHNNTERLEKMAEYATHYPNGAFIGEIRAVRAAEEESLWATSNSTQEGLQQYLRAYPDGAHATQANQRLAAVGAVQARRGQEQERVENLAERRQVDATESRRLWVGRAMNFWVETLLGIPNYGTPIAQMARTNPRFSQAFGQAPEPTCNPRSCIKHYQSHYGVPNPGGTRIERDMHFYLRLLLNRGRVERVEVLLPNRGFSRWQELENRTMVLDEDPEARQAAIQWAMQQIAQTLTRAANGSHDVEVAARRVIPLNAAEIGTTAPESETATTIAEPTPAPAQNGAAANGATPSANNIDSALDALLSQAAGVDNNAPQTTEPTPAPTPTPSEPTVDTRPTVVRAFVYRNLRVVFFAASDNDTGEAFDGFWVERVS